MPATAARVCMPGSTAWQACKQERISCILAPASTTLTHAFQHKWLPMQALFSSRGLAQCTIDTSQPVGTVIQASIEMYLVSSIEVSCSLQSAVAGWPQKAGG